MLEVIVNWIVLVVSPQFEMQFFVPGHEPVYINNEAPSLLFMPSNFFFQHEPPNHANIHRTPFSIVYIVAYLKKLVSL